jgi:hypothetical protein
MNMLFVLPSVGYGLYLFATTGSPILLAMSAFTVAIYSLVSNQRELDIKEPVSVRADRVYLGDRRLSLFPWLWGKKVRDAVYQTLIDETQFEQQVPALFPGQLFDLSQQEVFNIEPDERNPHLIIIGRSGSGKTQLLKWILSARDDYYLIDFKGGVDFPEVDSTRLFTQHSVPEAIELIQELLRSRELNPQHQPIWVVVDELGELIRGSALLSQLESIASKGRGLGLHLVLLNQTMTGVPRTIWANCAHRIVLSADAVDRVQLGFSATATVEQNPNLICGEYRGDQARLFGFPIPIASSKPSQEADEESAPFAQTLEVHRSVVELAEQPHLHGHLLGRRVQPYTWPD